MMDSLSVLLLAAKYIEKNEELSTTTPILKTSKRHYKNSKKCKSRKTKLPSSRKDKLEPVFLRSMHNESEKMRRAHMRNCIDHLRKAMHDVSSGNSPPPKQHSTQQVLNRATKLIHSMRHEQRILTEERDQLLAVEKNLECQISKLKETPPLHQRLPHSNIPTSAKQLEPYPATGKFRAGTLQNLSTVISDNYRAETSSREFPRAKYGREILGNFQTVKYRNGRPIIDREIIGEYPRAEYSSGRKVNENFSVGILGNYRGGITCGGSIGSLSPSRASSLSSQNSSPFCDHDSVEAEVGPCYDARSHTSNDSGCCDISPCPHVIQ